MRAQKGGNLKMEVQEKPTQEGSENQEVEDDMVKENYNDPGEREDDEDYFLNEDSIGSEILDWGVERAQKSEKLEMEVRETETQPEDGMLEENYEDPGEKKDDDYFPEEDSEDVDSEDGDTSSGSSDEEYTPSPATTVAPPKKKVAAGGKLLMQGEEMSEYEKIRAANIKQKEEMLKTLQLKGDWQDLKESEGLVAASGRSQKQKQKRASHVLRTEAEHRSQGKKDEILTSSHDGLVLFSLCNLKMFHEFQIYEMHMILEISHAFHIHEI